MTFLWAYEKVCGGGGGGGGLGQVPSHSVLRCLWQFTLNTLNKISIPWQNEQQNTTATKWKVAKIKYVNPSLI